MTSKIIFIAFNFKEKYSYKWRRIICFCVKKGLKRIPVFNSAILLCLLTSGAEKKVLCQSS